MWAAPRHASMILKSRLTSAGICFVSAVPIESSHKIRMSRRRDLGSRSSDTSSDRPSLTQLTQPASVEKRPLSRPDVLI
jgi:hypothetical protein